MSLFQQVLDQLSKKLQGNRLNKEEISEIISAIIGIKIVPDQIKIIKDKIYFSVSPTIKTVIHLKKQRIIEELNKFNIRSIG